MNKTKTEFHLCARLVFAFCGLLLGGLIGALPGYALTLMAAPRPRTPEVFALSETDLIAILLWAIGVPAGALCGALLGFRFASRSA